MKMKEQALSELRKDCIAAAAMLAVAMLVAMVAQWI
jgi:hypothetical protein